MYKRQLLDEIRVNVDKIPHTELAQVTVRQQLGDLYYTQGWYGKAVEPFTAAMRLCSNLPSEGKLIMSECKEALALVHIASGNLKLAEPLLENVLETRRALVGEEHPLMAETLTALARFHLRRKQLVEAEGFFERAKRIQQALHGDNAVHPAFLPIWQGLATVYQQWEQPRLADALRLYKKQAHVLTQLYGPKFADVARANLQAAEIAEQLKEWKQAETLYVGAMTTEQALNGADHKQTQRLNEVLRKLRTEHPELLKRNRCCADEGNGCVVM